MTYEEYSCVVFEGDDGVVKGLEAGKGEENAGAKYRKLIFEAAREVGEGDCMVLTPEATVGRKGWERE